MHLKRIQLINAPLAKDFCPSIRAGAFPPLHLASLAAYVRLHCRETEIQILDGELMTVPAIQTGLDAPLVGISCNSLTYRSALEIAAAAKQKGALVFLGGAHATFAGDAILRHRDYVDGVIRGDGEDALLSLARGHRFEEIPNLMFRQNGAIQSNPQTVMDLNAIPPPDYTGLPLDQYFLNYRTLYPDKPFRRPFANYSAKGCRWRATQGGGCVFCAIQHKGFRLKSVSRLWEELRLTQDEWGCDFFWDVSDTFTMQRSWVRELALAKPRGSNVAFQVYGRAPDIDDELASMLARIGVYELFIGLESGSNELLSNTQKGATVEQSIAAVRTLNRWGIKVVISIVLGLPGETEHTLDLTTNMVRDLLEWADLSEINCSILLPLPGSALMTLLESTRQKDPSHSSVAEDLFDPDAVRREYVRRFCKVGYDTIMATQGELQKMHHRVGMFGQTISERAIQTEKPTVLARVG